MPENSELEDLTLAFQLYVVDQVVESDLVKTSREIERLEEWLPSARLVEAGFVDERGARTERFHQMAARALAELPSQLGHGAKLDLLHTVVRIAAADRAFRLGEGSILLSAARLLGLGDEEFDAFLASYPDAVGMSAAVLERSEEAAD